MSGWDAMTYNVVAQGHVWPFLYIVWGPALFAGADMPVTVIIATLVTLALSMTYYLFSVTMPRSGGDFVWVSRSLHPSIAFPSSFLFAIIIMSFLGIIGGWVVDPSLRSIFVVWGVLTNNGSMVTQITALLTPTNEFIVSTLVVLLACLLNLIPAKTMVRVLWTCFLIGLLGIFTFCGVMLAAGHATFVARFNLLSGANYLGIINSAQSAGYFTGFAVFATVLGTMYAFQNFLGFAYSIYVGGEVKQVNRSQGIGIIGSTLVLGLVTWAIYEVSYDVIGPEFMHSAAYLAMNGNSAWTLPMLPYLNYLVAFATPNPWLGILPGIGLMAAAFGCCIVLVSMSTRMIFAYSFDRILPTMMSDVDDRFHVPRNAVGLTFIIAMVFVYLAFFSSVLTYYTYSSIGLWIPQIIIGIAAMVFPYRRKDILEKAPGFVKKQVAGIPILTICGAITTVVAVFNTIVPITPLYTGAAINPIYILAILVTIVPGPVIYGLAYWRNRRMGIDMSVGFRELPPA
jgi:amino acid transporter